MEGAIYAKPSSRNVWPVCVQHRITRAKYQRGSVRFPNTGQMAVVSSQLEAFRSWSLPPGRHTRKRTAFDRGHVFNKTHIIQSRLHNACNIDHQKSKQQELSSQKECGFEVHGYTVTPHVVGFSASQCSFFGCDTRTV